MSGSIFWEYLEELPDQEAAWREWNCRLAHWHCFNTFYTRYLRVEDKRAKFLGCMTPCEHGCPRRIVENSPNDIVALCPQNKADPVHLKFRDILIYSIRLEVFHQALCAPLNIKYSADRRKEHEHVRHLGGYFGTEVYVTYRTVTLADTISSLFLSYHAPFILMVPTMKNITLEIQQFIAGNNLILLSMADELHLQPDGSFRLIRSINERMKSSNGHFPQ